MRRLLPGAGVVVQSAGDRDEKCFFPLDWEPDVLVRYRCPILM